MEWEVDDAAPTRLRNDPLPSDLEATRVFHDGTAAPVVDPPLNPAAPAPARPRDAVGEATLVFPLTRPVAASSAARALPAVAAERRQLFAIAALAFCVTSLLITAAIPFALSLI